MFPNAFDNFIALPCVPKACGLLPKCAWSGSSCFGKDTGYIRARWLHNPGDSMRKFFFKMQVVTPTGPMTPMRSRQLASSCRPDCEILWIWQSCSWKHHPSNNPVPPHFPLGSLNSFCRLSYPWLEPGYNVFRAIERWAGVVRKLRLSFSCEGMVLGSWCRWLGSCPFGFGGARVPLSRCGGRCNNLIGSWDQWPMVKLCHFPHPL